MKQIFGIINLKLQIKIFLCVKGDTIPLNTTPVLALKIVIEFLAITSTESNGFDEFWILMFISC